MSLPPLLPSAGMSPASSTPRGSGAVFPTIAVAVAFCPTHRRCWIHRGACVPLPRPSASPATPASPLAVNPASPAIAASERTHHPYLLCRLLTRRRVVLACAAVTVLTVAAVLLLAASATEAPGRCLLVGASLLLYRPRVEPHAAAAGCSPGDDAPSLSPVAAPPPPLKAKASLPTKF